MKLKIAFGALVYVGKHTSYCLTPMNWKRWTITFPKMGGGFHVSKRIGPLEIIKPNHP